MYKPSCVAVRGHIRFPRWKLILSQKLHGRRVFFPRGKVTVGSLINFLRWKASFRALAYRLGSFSPFARVVPGDGAAARVCFDVKARVRMAGVRPPWDVAGVYPEGKFVRRDCSYSCAPSNIVSRSIDSARRKCVGSLLYPIPFVAAIWTWIN